MNIYLAFHTIFLRMYRVLMKSHVNIIITADSRLTYVIYGQND